MPNDTVPANATALPKTSRRSFLKTSGALGAGAALAVPVALMQKAQATEHADAELLAYGPKVRDLRAVADAKLSALAPLEKEFFRRRALMERPTPPPIPILDRTMLLGEWMDKMKEQTPEDEAYKSEMAVLQERENNLSADIGLDDARTEGVNAVEALTAMINEVCEIRAHTLEGLIFKACLIPDPDDWGLGVSIVEDLEAMAAVSGNGSGAADGGAA